jgi:hypothetical protein
MEAILRDGYSKGETFAEIAERLGWSRDQWRAVANQRYRLGLTRDERITRRQRTEVGKRGGQRQRAFWTDADLERLRWAADAFARMDDVMKYFPGRSYASVSSKMLKEGMTLRKKEPESEPEPERPPPPAHKPPGTPISLPQRSSATPVPDLAEWEQRKDAKRRRLEMDGGNLTTERRTA